MKDHKPDSIESFCEQTGIGSIVNKEKIKAGRNSEVWKISTKKGFWLLKNYYKNSGDSRDRLGTEFGFLVFLSKQGVHNIPLPIGRDSLHNRGLYSFIPGDRPTIIDSHHIKSAAEFIKSINKNREEKAAIRISNASDACFSIQDHMNSVNFRIQRLIKIVPKSEIEKSVVSFIFNKLIPAWKIISRSLEQGLERDKFMENLSEKNRIISPSDFGFHNSLEFDGIVSFIDFEYAGWDDPAKLICDFICQPEVPVSKIQAKQFSDELFEYLPDSDSIISRVEKLLPVHRLKWCCLMLNEFSSIEKQRRLYAGIKEEGLLQEQLSKAEFYFDSHLSKYIELL